MPQTLKVEITQPHKSETVTRAPSTALRITGRTESAIERERRILKTIRERTFGILSEADLSLVRVRVDARRK
jgi:hypothetical protein